MNDIDPVEVIKALSDRNRIRIVTMIGNDEMCACKILEKMEISQPTLSHHMSILEKTNIVNKKRVGQTSRYSLNKDTLMITSDYLRSMIRGTYQ